MTAIRRLSDWYDRLPPWAQILLAASTGLLLVVVLAFPLRQAPGGVDWYRVFRPAAREALALRSPYGVEITPDQISDPAKRLPFFNPPWLLPPLMLVALLPPEWGRGVMLLLAAIGFVAAARRLGGSPVAIGLFMMSPIALLSLFSTNIDWLILLGFTLPPQIGLFFVLLKPQMTGMVALFWLVEAWREGGVREVLRVFWPVTAVTALSFVIFGWWPLQGASVAVTGSFNWSIFPTGIPLGLVAIAAAIQHREQRLAQASMPFLSPYITLNSWSGALASLLPSDWLMAAAVAGLYLIGGLRLLLGY